MSNVCAKPYRACAHQPCLANAAPPPRKPEDADPLRASDARGVAPRWAKPNLAVRLRTQLSLAIYQQREQTLKSVSRAATLARNGAGLTSSVEHFVARPPWEPQHQERVKARGHAISPKADEARAG